MAGNLKAHLPRCIAAEIVMGVADQGNLFFTRGIEVAHDGKYIVLA